MLYFFVFQLLLSDKKPKILITSCLLIQTLTRQGKLAFYEILDFNRANTPKLTLMQINLLYHHQYKLLITYPEHLMGFVDRNQIPSKM